MGGQLLVTQALDERELLIHKIMDKIKAASFVDMAKHNEERTAGKRLSREEYAKQAQRAFQQIMDLVERYQKIDAAIVASNANTKIQTSYGEYTVAGAISLRNRLKAVNGYEGKNFENSLYDKMQEEYERCIQSMNAKNRHLDDTAESMRLSILGKDARTKETKPLAVVDAYVKENKAELVDPLGIVEKMQQLKERKEKLIAELETQIKVSNATTHIILN